ncbi:MAG: hypothetical protein RJB37_3696 [Pseudomonadota bacterium]
MVLNLYFSGGHGGIDTLHGILYSLKVYKIQVTAMPRTAVENNHRMSLRMTPEVKTKLLRAASIRNTDLTNFVTQSALREAEAVIHEAEVIQVTERDFQRILDLLDNPPPPNAKLLAAAKALPAST